MNIETYLRNLISGLNEQKGDCFDNAPIESFWGILKINIPSSQLQNKGRAKVDITKYIERQSQLLSAWNKKDITQF